MRSVLFESRDAILAGQLYLPGGYTESEQYPAIAVADAGEGRAYAQRLADHGFVTLLFEADGSDDGVLGAVDFLAGLRFVDAARIGVLGDAQPADFSGGRVKAASRIPSGGVDAAMNLLAPFFMRRL